MKKKRKNRHKQRKLTQDELRVLMEQKLKAKTIPSKKIYNRKKKDQ